jgi:hypothetical protein
MRRVAAIVAQNFQDEELVYPCCRITEEGWRIYTNIRFTTSAYGDLGVALKRNQT